MRDFCWLNWGTNAIIRNILILLSKTLAVGREAEGKAGVAESVLQWTSRLGEALEMK